MRLVARENVDRKVLMVPRETGERQESVVVMDHKVWLELEAPQDRRETKDSMDVKVSLDPLVNVVSLDLVVSPGLLEHRDKMVVLVPPVSPEIQGHLVCLDPPDQVVSLVTMEMMEIRGNKALAVTLDHQ